MSADFDPVVFDPAGMHELDRFSAGLGIELVSVDPGAAEVQMVVDDRHLNGHGAGHGAAVFAIADAALASASNSHGADAVAATVTIDFVAPVAAGDVLVATATERYRSGRTAFYDIDVTNGRGVVAVVVGRTKIVGG